MSLADYLYITRTVYNFKWFMREGGIIISTDFRIEEQCPFWQSSESRYYCLLIFLMINLPQLRQHIMIPSGIDSSLPLFSRAGSSEIIRARVYHAISHTESISAENSKYPVAVLSFSFILNSGMNSTSLLLSSS